MQRRESVRWLLFCGVPSSLIVLVTLVSVVGSLWPCHPEGPCNSTAVVIVLSLLAYALLLVWPFALLAYALMGRDQRDSQRDEDPVDPVVPTRWARGLMLVGAVAALALVAAIGPDGAEISVVAVGVWLVGVIALAWSWLGRDPRSSLTLASVALVSSLVGALVSYS